MENLQLQMTEIVAAIAGHFAVTFAWFQQKISPVHRKRVD
jgi:hypothetical protein